MAITIRFQGGQLAGKVLGFGDEVETITIGRNPDRCQVIFPAAETHVGREHCALHRVLGRYRLILNGEDRVFINGKEAYHEEELPASADMKLGPAGPQIVAITADQTGLPQTVGRGQHQPGMGTQLAGAKQKSISGMRIALLAILALCVASAVGYHLHNWTAEQVDKNKDELNKAAPDLAEHLQAAAPSVYLVLVKTPLGEFSDGTAWVIADDTLATNAHIAQTFVSGLGPDDKLICRSSSNPPVDFEVTGVQIHPGYGRFDEIVKDRSPSLIGVSGNRDELNLIQACDLALLKVSNSSGLAPPLTLATDEEAQALKPGDPIGMIGYPSENVMGHNTATPQPSIETGRVSRLTDFLLRTDGAPQSSQLIHHSIPATGGASGSPILNPDGKVIAINCAGNFIQVNPDTRIPTAVGLNFAQRADVLRELLDNRADDAQKTREAQWQAELNNFSLMDDEDSLLSAGVKTWTDKTPNSHAVEISRTRLVLKATAFNTAHVARYQVPVSGLGSYLFHFYSIGREGVTFRLFSSPMALEAQQVDKDMAYDQFEYASILPGTISLEFESDRETPATVDVVAYRLDAAPSLFPLAPSP